jgi:hypothetical protein
VIFVLQPLRNRFLAIHIAAMANVEKKCNDLVLVSSREAGQFFFNLTNAHDPKLGDGAQGRQHAVIERSTHRGRPGPYLPCYGERWAAIRRSAGVDGKSGKAIGHLNPKHPHKQIHDATLTVRCSAIKGHCGQFGLYTPPVSLLEAISSLPANNLQLVSFAEPASVPQVTILDQRNVHPIPNERHRQSHHTEENPGRW